MPLYIVILRYLVPLEQIDLALEPHRAWVDQGFKDGVFLLSGPQIPRTGGAILAQGLSRAELDQRLAQDPFASGGLARHEVIEMMPRGADPRLAFLL